MSFYVEVMCNEHKDWPNTPAYAGKLTGRCLSNRGDNPQGQTLASATATAREQGWTVRGRYACCPECQQVLEGEAARDQSEA